MNQAHRSAGKIAQRFDHPTPAPEWTYSRVKIRSWRSNRDVCFSNRPSGVKRFQTIQQIAVAPLSLIGVQAVALTK